MISPWGVRGKAIGFVDRPVYLTQCGQEKCPPKTVMAMIVANDSASSKWNQAAARSISRPRRSARRCSRSRQAGRAFDWGGLASIPEQAGGAIVVDEQIRKATARSRDLHDPALGRPWPVPVGLGLAGVLLLDGLPYGGLYKME
jgi:hypothetical protein